MKMQEWLDILQTLNAASAEPLNRLTDKDLKQLESLLDHWHKMARSARVARLEQASKVA